MVNPSGQSQGAPCVLVGLLMWALGALPSLRVDLVIGEILELPWVDV